MLMRGVRQDVRQRKPQRGRIPVQVSVRQTASILQKKSASPTSSSFPLGPSMMTRWGTRYVEISPKWKRQQMAILAAGK